MFPSSKVFSLDVHIVSKGLYPFLQVLTAMEKGESLMKALEGAVPDEVRGKLRTAVTGIVQSQGINLNVDGLRKIIPNMMPRKLGNQKESEESSAIQSVQVDVHSADQRKDDVGSDGETLVTESAPKRIDASQEKTAQASYVEGATEVGDKRSEPAKSEEASGGTYENNGEQGQVNQSSGEGNKESAEKQVLNDGNDIHNREIKEVDVPAEQSTPTSLTNSEEALLGGLSDPKHNAEEKENDVQKNENKIKDVGDQSIQNSTKPEEQSPQHSSSKPPPISVTQALDALTGFDDTTQMAVNSVFGVIEEMIDQFEKTSDQKDGGERTSDENHELGDKPEKTDSSNGVPGGDPDLLKSSNYTENDLKEEDAKSSEEVQHKLKEVSFDLTSSVNNSIAGVNGSHEAFKNLNSQLGNDVGHAQNFPLDLAGKRYWESQYVAYLHRFFTMQSPTMKSVDLEPTTDLFLDPKEGQWRMIDQLGYTKNNLGEDEENQSSDGSDQIVCRPDMETIIEPSYVIVDNEFSRFEYGPAEEYVAASDKENDRKAEFICMIKKTLQDALKIEVGRKLGKADLENTESNLISDLERFSDTVSRAVVHGCRLGLDSFLESGSTDSMKFGTIEAKYIIETISSAVSGASHLRKILPLGVIAGSTLASLRSHFQVVSLYDDDQSEAIPESRRLQENSYGQESRTKKAAYANEKDQHVDSDNLIGEAHQVRPKDGLNSKGIMVGAVTAALGASALLAHHEVIARSFRTFCYCYIFH